jgi:hypothetical protein
VRHWAAAARQGTVDACWPSARPPTWHWVSCPSKALAPGAMCSRHHWDSCSAASPVARSNANTPQQPGRLHATSSGAAAAAASKSSSVPAGAVLLAGPQLQAAMPLGLTPSERAPPPRGSAALSLSCRVAASQRSATPGQGESLTPAALPLMGGNPSASNSQRPPTRLRRQPAASCGQGKACDRQTLLCYHRLLASRCNESPL